jgi:small subunit ribosomal protein S1
MSDTSSSKSSSLMAQLLAKHTKAFVSLNKGESVKARITKLTNSEILVDAGAKTEAHVLEKDKRILHTILGMFKVGDEVEVNVLNPESEYGNPVVSLRRYLGNIAWTKLEELEKSKDQLEVTVKDVTKAGFVVETDFGISGFLPQSHTSEQGIAPSQRIKVKVLELLRKDNKVIFSQKATMSEDDFAVVTKQFKVGEKVEVTVGNVTSFGVFVNLVLPKPTERLTTVEGFLHISEASWDKVDDLSDTFTPGQKVEMVVTRFDTDNRKINLSVKRLTADPFEELMEKYPVDAKVTGTVSKVEEAGVTIDLDEGIEGFVKKEKVPPGTSYTVDQSATFTVAEHDKKKHRLLLTPVLKEKPLMYR